MRPVFMENPNATWSEVAADSYMWGSAFYVLPVFSKLDGKMNVRMMTLQDESVWFDFFSGEKLSYNKDVMGKKVEDLLINLTLDHIPFYVKAGSFVPLADKIQSTEDPSVKNSTGLWFEDDGKTANAYEKGNYGIIYFTGNESNKSAGITLKKEIGTTGNDNFNGFKMEIHASKAKKIKINGKKVNFKTNQAGSLLLDIPSFSNELKIEILR